MTHQHVLRWSLLGSLGLVPIACSGSSDTPDPEGQAGANNEAGMPAASGSTSTPSAGQGEGGGSETVLPGAGGGGGGLRPSCTSPSFDAATGLTTCEEGYRYRASAAACSIRRNEAFAEAYGSEGGAGGGNGNGGAAGDTPGLRPFLQPPPSCSTPCEGEHGFCNIATATPRVDVCAVGCLDDAECGDGRLCLCGGEWGGVCEDAHCRSDADCDDGYHCVEEQDVCGVTSDFVCQKAEDECLTSADCGDERCQISKEPYRTCEAFPSCGRPFLVASKPRIAPIVERADWLVGALWGYVVKRRFDVELL